MFELEQSPFGKYRLYRVHHPESSNGFSIVPGLGANILEIVFGGNNVIDGYRTPEELEAGKWGKSALLFPFPNRLRDGRYNWLGRDYVFPINNAATGNAIHGFVRHEAFEVTHTELTAENAEITCRLEYSGHLAYFPFPFTLEAVFNMTDRGAFTAAFFVRNRHSEAIPVGLGWHPYFNLAANAADHLLHLPACSLLEIDERMLPTGGRLPYTIFSKPTAVSDTVLDNCFHVDDSNTLFQLALHANGRSITLAGSRDLFPYFQVFTPPHRASIALEPMTCNVNAFQNGDGLVTLPPGGDWSTAFLLEYR
ncbi:MAG: aldose 1-epimerase [Saprospiraceae bacterium]